ncbi:MAG: hypothetical protein C4530_08835 [Desulfobacteraceae bacterium]|nr:MAG: hypothetical protein C4530_08835 [Desulfobacteraceae bacterium]
MSEIKARIDGRQVSGHQGMTILEAARSVGIEIPTLCYSPDLTPSGNCRMCVVEVEGARILAGACHTPIADGMVIMSRSPKVLAARKAIVELLMAGHTGECVADARTGTCGLRKLADEMEVGAPRFPMRKPRWYPIEEFNAYVRRDMSRCILCRRCIGACTEIARKSVYGVAYRGFLAKVVAGQDVPLSAEVCRNCGICTDYCPTGALSRTEGPGEGARTILPQRNAPESRRRAVLLGSLKEAQRRFGYVPREFMSETARSLGIPVSEVYGVATFYSFLSTRPLGKYVIRICNGVPCAMKHADIDQMVIDSVAGEIGIMPGQTTADGKFSLELTGCIGACDAAPAMRINDEVHGRLHPDRIVEILRAYP